MTKPDPRVAMTPSECERLMESYSAKSPSGVRNRTIVALMWRCGLRYSEIAGIRVADVKHGGSTILVGNVAEGRARELPIPAGAYFQLMRWDGERLRLKRRYGSAKAAPYFCTIEKRNFGGELSASYLRGMLERGMKSAGLRYRFHQDLLRDALTMELRVAGHLEHTIRQFLMTEDLPILARFNEIDHEPYRDPVLAQNHWAHRNPLEFSRQQGTMVPEPFIQSEQPRLAMWNDFTAMTDGYPKRSLREERLDPEDTSKYGDEQGDLRGELRALNAKVDRLTALVETLLKTQAGGGKGN